MLSNLVNMVYLIERRDKYFSYTKTNPRLKLLNRLP
jgi:hypothetical protein